MKKMKNKKQIEAIKEFFVRNEIPKEPIMLNKWTRLENPQKFVEVHIAMIEAMDEKIAKPYISRLRELSLIIITNKTKDNEQIN